MNAKKSHPERVLSCLVWQLVGLCLCTVGWSQNEHHLINEGNALYHQGEYTQALNQYEQALQEDPQALTATFNQANAYLKLDDLDEALNRFRQVAAESKDMSLVAKAKYNLGNTYFHQGLKQRDGDLQKALKSMETSITSWRSVLELNPEHTNAARNIEVARLMIKDIIDQINQQQDPNQGDQQQNQQQEQQQSPQDPNQAQPQDPNQTQDPNQAQDPNEGESQSEPQEPQPSEAQEEPHQDMTAQQILDKEQQQKEARRRQQRSQRHRMEKDW